jgi:dynein heavy chain
MLNLISYFSTGEVPNLFESDEYEKVIIACRPPAKEAGVYEENRDGIFDFFISRVRSRLHLAICMSPVGDAFRFPLYYKLIKKKMDLMEHI